MTVQRRFHRTFRKKGALERLLAAMLGWMVASCSPRHSTVVTAYSRSSVTPAPAPGSRRSTVDSNAPPKRPNHSPIRIPWLIVGGGIHGVHIAARLIGGESCGRSGKIQPDHVCIIDDNPKLLQRWKSRTAATGMKYLRSSASFHLDVSEQSLRRHVKKSMAEHSNNKSSSSSSSFSRDYERPKLDVFNQHCDYVIEKYRLDQLHVQGTVTKLEPQNDGSVRVEVAPSSSPSSSHSDNDNDVVYSAENVVLALGNDDPSYAEWVEERDIEEGLVRHLLDDQGGGDLSASPIKNVAAASDDDSDRIVAVVGGGITAAHKALELWRDGGGSRRQVVHLISRHSLVEQQFDTHQDWMMDRAAGQRSLQGGGSGTPKRQRVFRLQNWKERRQTIVRERKAGTITPAIHRGNDGLCYAIQNGAIQWHQAEILEKKRCVDNKQQRVRIRLSLSCGDVIDVNEILLATGFGTNLPGGKLTQELVETHGFQVSGYCGYPIVDGHLRWSADGGDDSSSSSQTTNIFVTGALAELELGPSARNIAGARLAAERILQAVSTAA